MKFFFIKLNFLNFDLKLNKPVFIMKIILIECPDKFFVQFFNSLHINLSIFMIILGTKIVREENSSIIESFHFKL